MRVEIAVDLGNERGIPPPTRRATPDHPSPTARLIALAYHFDHLLQTGRIENMATLARMCGVSRARVSQVMGLLTLAPKIQSRFLMPTAPDHAGPLSGHRLRTLARLSSWNDQRATLHS